MSQSISHPNFRGNPEIELDSIGVARKPSTPPGEVHVWPADPEFDSRGAVIDISHPLQDAYRANDLQGAAYC